MRPRIDIHIIRDISSTLRLSTEKKMNSVTVLVILATVGFSSAVSRTMIINTTILSIKCIKLLFTTYEVVYSRINIFCDRVMRVMPASHASRASLSLFQLSQCFLLYVSL
jgi:hypothetical protein